MAAALAAEVRKAVSALPAPPATAPVMVGNVTLTNTEPTVQRQFAEARRAAEDATATNAASARQAEAWNHLGKVYLAYRLGALGAACFTNALVAQPTHASSWYGLALVRLDQERYAEGFEAASNVIACLRADPGAPPSELGEARRLLADGLDRAGRLEEALSQLDLEHLGEPADSYSPIRATQVLMRLGRTLEAARRLEGIHRVSPGNLTVRALQAEAYQRLGQTNRAAEIRRDLAGQKVPQLARPDAWLRSVVTLNLSSAAKVDLGYASMQQRRFRAALKQFESVLAVDPKHTLARTYAGSCRLQLREHEQARAAFEELVREDASNDVARTGLALSMARLGDQPAAARLCREWLARDTNSVAALFADAEVRREFKDYAGAVTSLRALAAREPDVAGHVRSLANALAASGKSAEAGAVLNMRLRERGDNLELSLQLARLLATSRDSATRNPDAAYALATQLLEKHGTNLVLAETQALALAGAEEWARAEAALRALEPRVTAMVAARQRGLEGTEDIPDASDFPERFRRELDAVRNRRLYLEPWPFAEVDAAVAVPAPGR